MNYPPDFIEARPPHHSLCGVLRYTVLFIKSTEPNVLLAGALLSISIRKVSLSISSLSAFFSCGDAIFSPGLICAPNTEPASALGEPRDASAS